MMLSFVADPLAHIMRGLREHLMEKALRALVTPGYKDHIGLLSSHNTTNWYVLLLLLLLHLCCVQLPK